MCSAPSVKGSVIDGMSVFPVRADIVLLWGIREITAQWLRKNGRNERGRLRHGEKLAKAVQKKSEKGYEGGGARLKFGPVFFPHSEKLING